jgi:nucleoside-diphosphate-sugar epimerase
LVAGCEGVVHLSAELSRVDAMDRVNVTPTRMLARAADAAGARYFGHASSTVVYGSPRTCQVAEATPVIDVTTSVAKQYHAEPYMLEYARTKMLGEIELTRSAGRMSVDILRPTVVADLNRLLESTSWSEPRRIFALYRRTQHISAEDAAVAVVHLVRRGITAQPGGVEAYNICDEDCSTFRRLHERALAAASETCFHSPMEVPVVADFVKDMLRYRTLALRFPLGMLEIGNRKLLATGFHFPYGSMRRSISPSHSASDCLGSMNRKTSSSEKLSIASPIRRR